MQRADGTDERKAAHRRRPGRRRTNLRSGAPGTCGGTGCGSRYRLPESGRELGLDSPATTLTIEGAPGCPGEAEYRIESPAATDLHRLRGDRSRNLFWRRLRAVPSSL